jgi:hypothetical protein
VFLPFCESIKCFGACDGGLTLILSKKNNLEFSESAKNFSGLGNGHPAFAHNRSPSKDIDDIIPERQRRTSTKMVLQDLGRRINAAVSDLTRSSNLDEKV